MRSVSPRYFGHSGLTNRQKELSVAVTSVKDPTGTEGVNSWPRFPTFLCDGQRRAGGIFKIPTWPAENISMTRRHTIIAFPTGRKT
ncbi:unnamed protein product [Protopolystoma xenopodis]|uniref:Uncharacterized protein n=1 Tax=Protopolystoma xenopodis TaxID=117903 RepID=A0A3S5B1I7_9PLAT|nr:unnamed protein product [Protopolystoma xenopodis]